MGILNPAWMSKDEKKALIAVEKITNQDTLVRIASDVTCNVYASVQQAAFTKITDGKRIDRVRNNALEAVCKIKDQTKLARIAQEAWNWDVRTAATRMLTDQRTLEYLARNAKDTNVRKAAIRKLDNQSILFECVLYDTASHDNRMAALDRLTNQSFLTDIVQKSTDSLVRIKASEKLGDPKDMQKMFAEVVMTAQGRWTQVRAVEKLTDQKLLTDILKNNKERDVRRAAIKNITDQGVLADAARKDKDEEVRLNAVQRLDDQLSLADIARHDKRNRVRMEATKKLDDKALADKILIEITKNGKDGKMHMEVVECLNDKTALNKDTTKSDEDLPMRIADVLKLTDQTVLAKIALCKTCEKGIIKLAIKKLTDIETLTIIADSTDDQSYLYEWEEAYSPGDDDLVRRYRTQTEDLRNTARKRLVDLQEK